MVFQDLLLNPGPFVSDPESTIKNSAGPFRKRFWGEFEPRSSSSRRILKYRTFQIDCWIDRVQASPPQNQNFWIKRKFGPHKRALSLLSKKPPKIPAFPATLDTYMDTKISERLKTLRWTRVRLPPPPPIHLFYSIISVSSGVIDILTSPFVIHDS